MHGTFYWKRMKKKTQKVCHSEKHILSIVTRMSISLNALLISSFKLREENGNLEIMFVFFKWNCWTTELLDYKEWRTVRLVVQYQKRLSYHTLNPRLMLHHSNSHSSCILTSLECQTCKKVLNESQLRNVLQCLHM